MARKMTDAQMDELERAMDARVPYTTVAELRKDIVALRSRVGRQHDIWSAGRGCHNALVAVVDALRETVQKHTAQSEDCESPTLDMRADIAVLHQAHIALRFRVDELAKMVRGTKEPVYPFPSPECICAHRLEYWQVQRDAGWASSAWDCPKHGRITAGRYAHVP